MCVCVCVCVCVCGVNVHTAQQHSTFLSDACFGPYSQAVSLLCPSLPSPLCVFSSCSTFSSTQSIPRDLAQHRYPISLVFLGAFHAALSLRSCFSWIVIIMMQRDVSSEETRGASVPRCELLWGISACFCVCCVCCVCVRVCV